DAGHACAGRRPRKAQPGDSVALSGLSVASAAAATSPASVRRTRGGGGPFRSAKTMAGFPPRMRAAEMEEMMMADTGGDRHVGSERAGRGGGVFFARAGGKPVGKGDQRGQ